MSKNTDETAGYSISALVFQLRVGQQSVNVDCGVAVGVAVSGGGTENAPVGGVVFWVSQRVVDGGAKRADDCRFLLALWCREADALPRCVAFHRAFHLLVPAFFHFSRCDGRFHFLRPSLYFSADFCVAVSYSEGVSPPSFVYCMKK